MERSAFEYLYMHANSLAELGFELAAADFLNEAANEPDPLAHLSDDERRALALEQLRQAQELHESGVETELDRFYRDFAARPKEEFPEEDPAPAEAPAPGEQPDGAEPAERDLGVYLEKVYASSAVLAQRVDQTMAQVDMAQIEAALAALPAGLPPLTGRLDAAGFEQWLQLYRDQDAALDDLVTSIRFAEFT